MERWKIKPKQFSGVCQGKRRSLPILGPPLEKLNAPISAMTARNVSIGYQLNPLLPKTSNLLISIHLLLRLVGVNLVGKSSWRHCATIHSYMN